MSLVRRLLGVLLLAALSLGCRAALVVPPLPEPAAETAAVATTEPEPIPQPDPGRLPRMLRVPSDGIRPFLLERTQVDAVVLGGDVRVRVRQILHNPESRAIGGIYQFELPEGARVDRLHMVIGERTIASVVRPANADAKPEAFDRLRHGIAEIPANARIEVEVDYLLTLAWHDGELKFLLPRVDERDDAVSLHVEVEAGAPVERWSAPPEAIVTATEAGFSAQIDEIRPEQDIAIRWRPALDRTRATLYLGPADGEGRGHFSLLLLPPTVGPDHGQPSELIFALDNSASRSTTALWDAANLVRASLARLGPNDRFNLITFGGRSSRLFAQSRSVNKANLVMAERFLAGLEAGRGAHLHEVLEVLRAEIGAGARRFIVVVSDRAIGNDRKLVDAAADLVARAEAAGARAHVMGLDEPAVVERIFRYIDPPVLAEMAIDWAGVDAQEMFPGELPELIAGESVQFVGRYHGKLTGTPMLRGRVPGRRELIELPVAVVHGDERILATKWARAQLDDVVRRRNEGELQGERVRELMTSIGIDLQVVTPLTSMFAVDSRGGVGEAMVLIGSKEPLDLDFGRYMLGYSLESICFGLGDPVIVYEQPEDPATILPLGHAVWAPDSVLRITGLASSEGVDRRAVRRALRERAPELEACHEIHRSKAPKRTLRYRLHFDAGSQRLAVELLEGSFGEAGERCLATVFERIAWRGLPAERSVVELTLQLRLR